MISIKKLTSLGVGVLLFAMVAFPAVIGAQDSGGTGSGLQISPTRTELEVNPGESKSLSINVKNVTQGDVFAKAFINDFESDGTTGTPRLITDENETTPYTISNMLSGQKDLNLKPDEQKTVDLTVSVPEDAVPGAYFGAVRYAAVPQSQAGDGGQQVALTASVAHLVFVNVPGEVNEQIELQNLEIARGDSASGIFFNSPDKSRLTVKNLGNGFARPFGSIAVYDMSDNEVSKQDVNATEPRGIVLPDSTRVFDTDLSGLSKPGKYKVVASVAYSNGGEVVNLEASFWYLPLWFVAAVAVALILIAGGGYYAYRRFVVNR